jgi:hypothetical protein
VSLANGAGCRPSEVDTSPTGGTGGAVVMTGFWAAPRVGGLIRLTGGPWHGAARARQSSRVWGHLDHVGGASVRLPLFHGLSFLLFADIISVKY